MVQCPGGERRSLVSTDADLFLRHRSRSLVDFTQPPRHGGKKWFHLLEITNDCNACCPVCYADSGNGDPKNYMPYAQVVEKARGVRQSGGRVITLTGGEPTLNKDLPRMISKARELGLIVEIATNGLVCGQDESYARLLKKSGLTRAWLQFDTLDPQTHRLMRGHDHIAAKKKAAENIIKSGIRLGFVVTVTRYNCDQLSGVIDYALSLGPGFQFIVFQVAAPGGRFLLPKEAIVDKEIVMKAVAAAALKDEAGTKHFWPIPSFAPWKAELHPDCSAVMFLCTGLSGRVALDHYVDMPLCYQRLHAEDASPGFWSRNVLPLWHLIRSIRKSAFWNVVLTFFGFITAKGSRSMVVLSVDSFLGYDYQDEQRIARCANSHVTDEGLISPCVYNYPDPARPFSRHNKKGSVHVSESKV
ncbi:MAG: radical SAM protein [Candidatus Omnitrophota bacterium]